jgi:hypothetical protein
MNVVARWRKQIIKLATARTKTLQHQRHQHMSLTPAETHQIPRLET